ncbi:galactokinase family protein [Corynebacterium halotolerans]|uniref:Galactokinase n=1 Tax=Corynebacterium halotolerans YIM 70093 = DSM 44683 TaxID=1121362 RepID=M1P8L0_9CORY|nr:galactokinase family protein [Corynebacterium halotolerans]AGF72991.1 Galactokinase [Corynebacterium halotolerans YIM 70093 = DSM 44683]
MPLWPGADRPAIERVIAAHEEATGSPAAHAAEAPATWSLIGEHVDHAGGVVLMALTDLRAAVAYTPRRDDLVRVTHLQTTPDGVVTTTDEISTGVVARRAAAQQPGVDDRGRTLTPPAPEGGLAARLGGVIWTLIHRQLLSRDTAGADVTVVTDIPAEAGLGARAALEAAFALALQADADDLDDAPMRARLAEVCTQSAEMFSATPPLRARHTAALRGVGDTVSAIDYADGSVTQVPHPVTRDTAAFAVFAPGPAPDESGAIRTRRRFLDSACHAFGAESLRLLPDAPQRVVEWLEAVHKVHGTDGTPAVKDAAAWLAFNQNETVRAQQLSRALRSRRAEAVWPLLADSQAALTGPYGLSGAAELVELCRVRGAKAARAAAAGVSGAVIAYVDAGHAANFSADLAEDGLVVVPLRGGEVAAARR